MCRWTWHNIPEGPVIISDAVRTSNIAYIVMFPRTHLRIKSWARLFKSISSLHISWKLNFILSSHVCLSLSSGHLALLFFLCSFYFFLFFLSFLPPSQLNISLSFLTFPMQRTDTCLFYLIFIVVPQIIFGEVCRIWIFPAYSFLLCPIAPFQPIVRRPWAVFMAVTEWLIGITANLKFYITVITIRTYKY